MLRKTSLFAGGLLLGIVIGAAAWHFYLRYHTRNISFAHTTYGNGLLRQKMTMWEVEQLLGKPDHVDIIDGKNDGHYETPKQIMWTYSRFKITESGESYGKPGHIRFIPLRFMEKNSEHDDEVARQYGEQSDVFRTCSFSGSFPIKKEDWGDFGLLDGYPVKELNKKN